MPDNETPHKKLLPIDRGGKWRDPKGADQYAHLVNAQASRLITDMIDFLSWHEQLGGAFKADLATFLTNKRYAPQQEQMFKDLLYTYLRKWPEKTGESVTTTSIGSGPAAPLGAVPCTRKKRRKKVKEGWTPDGWVDDATPAFNAPAARSGMRMHQNHRVFAGVLSPREGAPLNTFARTGKFADRAQWLAAIDEVTDLIDSGLPQESMLFAKILRTYLKELPPYGTPYTPEPVDDDNDPADAGEEWKDQ